MSVQCWQKWPTSEINELQPLQMWIRDGESNTDLRLISLVPKVGLTSGRPHLGSWVKVLTKAAYIWRYQSSTWLTSDSNSVELFLFKNKKLSCIANMLDVSLKLIPLCSTSFPPSNKPEWSSLTPLLIELPYCSLLPCCAGQLEDNQT